MAKDGTAVLDTPLRGRAPGGEDGAARRTGGAPSLRRDLSEDFASPRRTRGRDGSPDGEADGRGAGGRRKAASGGFGLRFGRTISRGVVGRVVLAIGALTGVGLLSLAWVEAHAAMLHDARLVIPSSRAIQISGNNHLTRAQLLSVFGEDVDRNILAVPLGARRAELEALPWVEHATVMRLLPNTIRVSIVERTPVAFVRQRGAGARASEGTIGLVDAHGVLLDMSPELAADHNYSFPVVTGLAETDPIDTRAARMSEYLRFTGDLDAGPEKISRKLSEIDLTDPEDIKALIPDGSSDLLVHFGDDDFLHRYQRYTQNLADWKTRYPHLASVDLRYDREVVLEMAPGSTVPVAAGPSSSVVPARMAANSTRKPVLPRAAGRAAVSASPRKASTTLAKPQVPAQHLQRAFAVHSLKKPGKTGTPAPARSPQ